MCAIIKWLIRKYRKYILIAPNAETIYAENVFKIILVKKHFSNMSSWKKNGLILSFYIISFILKLKSLAAPLSNKIKTQIKDSDKLLTYVDLTVDIALEWFHCWSRDWAAVPRPFLSIQVLLKSKSWYIYLMSHFH